MKRFHITLSLWRLGTGLAAVAVVATVATHNLGHSLAATTNHAPTGSFTGLSCAYNGSYTFTISARWADSDAGINGSAPANAYITANNGNNTPASAIDAANYNGPTHTWTFSQAVLPDSRWPVELFVHDIDSGNGSWKLVAKANKPSCPAPPTPPSPSPPSTGGSTGSTGSTGTKHTTTITAPSAAPAAQASDANATVTTGTTATAFSIPAQGASKLYISYAETDGPAVTSDSQTVSTDPVVINLTNLDAASTYSYQIVRTSSAGVSATSPAASFTTKGYTAQLTFTTDKKKPVSGISGSINDHNNSAGKSDKNGKLTFSGLPSGSYTVAYTYKGKAYTKSFDTNLDTSLGLNSDNTPQIITLNNAVNVDTLGTSPVATSSHGNKFLVILGIVFVLGLIGGGAWFLFGLIRRRRLANEYGALNTPTNSGAFDQLPAAPVAAPALNTAPQAAHAGESLRDMVLESMREQHQLPQQQVGLLPNTLAGNSPQPALAAPATNTSAHPAVDPSAHPAHVTHQSHTAANSLPPENDGQTIQISHDR